MLAVDLLAYVAWCYLHILSSLSIHYNVAIISIVPARINNGSV